MIVLSLLMQKENSNKGTKMEGGWVGGRSKYIFANCDDIRIETMKHVIGKHQVNHCIYISGQPKILAIVASKCHLHIGKHFDSIRNEHSSFFIPIREKSFPCVVGGPYQNWRHWVSQKTKSPPVRHNNVEDM